MRHLDEEILADYALGASADPEVAAHLAECAECTVRLDAFIDTLREGDEELLDYAVRMQQEYLDASAALAPLLENAVAFVRERVERREEYRTAGAVRLLAEAANTACEREPIHARNLADAAVAIAGALPAGQYPAASIHALRGLAWKERANALRYLADYDDALDAVDRAAAELAHLGEHAFEFASLAYIRAVILTYTDRLDEATQQAAESAAVFEAHGDVDRAMRARTVQAGVLYYRRDYRAAAAIFEELRAFAQSKGDVEETARQSYNAAACWLEVGDAARAEALLTAGRRTWFALGQHTEVARADWKLGVAARVAGQLDESILLLRAAKVRCETLRMADEAANATLDLMESLLIVGRTSEIAPLCSEVMRYYRKAGKLLQALTAAAYLKEAAGAGTLRMNAIKHVRRFVETLDRRPELFFEPPPQEES